MAETSAATKFPLLLGGTVPGQDGKRCDLQSLCTSARAGRTP